AATAGGRRHEVAVALQAEDGELARDVTALARRAGNLRRRAMDVLLEISPAAATPILVDRHRLLAAALHVALHELFGVFLEDVVDLVKELVDVLLDLLALLRDLGTGGRTVAAALVGLGRSCFLLLLLCHVAPPWAPNRLTRRSSPRHAFILTEPPPPPRSPIRGSGLSARSAFSGRASG